MNPKELMSEYVKPIVENTVIVLLTRERDKWRGIAEELAEALKSAKGWVVTHAMQTYSKVADQEAGKIHELLQKFEQAVRRKNE